MMSATPAVISYTPACVNQTLTACMMRCMRTDIRRYIAVAGSMLLVVATFIGIPTKAYVKYLQYEPKCIDKGIPTPWTKHMAKTYAYGLMKMDYPTWGKGEWRALSKLWGKESAWDHTADNPKSTAYGIAQILNTKPGTPAPVQIDKGLSYISHRYGKPSIAWSHWRKHGWY